MLKTAAEHGLGQRRSVIGQMRFVPDQRDPPLKAFSTQGLRGRKARHTIADDRHMRRHHFTSPASRSTCTSPPSTLRSEEHTSELQSLMRISYAVFCLKKKKI